MVPKLRIWVIILSLSVATSLIYLYRNVRTIKLTGLVVVNVLSKELYDDCHIKGSIHIPMDRIQELEKFADKNAEVVVYCSNYLCSASGFARKKLLEIGFKKVWVYEGGTAEWYQKGLPSKGACKKDYLTKEIEKPAKIEPGVISAQELQAKIE